MGHPAQELPLSADPLREAVETAAQGGVTYVTHHGERLAAIVPAHMVEALEELEEAEDIAAAEAALAEGGDPIPLEVLRRELGV